ncbi:MAG: hypothetical protein ACOVQ0_00135 [Novosphingobium sp.]|uniref:hypothetical protein n=1 Tax=Novosphingobium sp. TaxID=1874826 RepID=UPI003B9BCD67
MPDRNQNADFIAKRLEEVATEVAATFRINGTTLSCHIRDILPIERATEIHSKFPGSEPMILKRSITRLSGLFPSNLVPGRDRANSSGFSDACRQCFADAGPPVDERQDLDTPHV